MNRDDLNILETFTTGGAYCQAKLANILFTRELNRRAKAAPQALDDAAAKRLREESETLLAQLGYAA